MFKNINVKREEGFTLIELLITVVILAVIMGIAIPVYVNNKNSADSAAAKSEVHAVADAISAGIGTGQLTVSDNSGATALTGSIVTQVGSQSVGGTVAFTNGTAFCVSEGGWTATEAGTTALGAPCTTF